MNTFEFNKIAAAFLIVALVVVVTKIIADEVFEGEEPERPGYVVAGLEPAPEPEPVETSVEVADADAGPTLATLLASATVDDGARAFRKCQACHTVESGGGHRAGPNLYGVVGRPTGSAEGFRYSDALATAGGMWTPEQLNEFLTSPASAIPGNTMPFAGIARDTERADLIAFLNAQSDTPLTFADDADDDMGDDDEAGEDDDNDG